MKSFAMASFGGALIAGAAFLMAEAPKKKEGDPGAPGLKIVVTSVPVQDQEKALKFYTEVLGFVKKKDVPAGGARWLTVVSPLGKGEVELLLEPIGFAPAKTFQKALFEKGIPWTQFGVDDIEKTYENLKKRGVTFSMKPTKMDQVTVAIFDDTCGNKIMIVQES